MHILLNYTGAERSYLAALSHMLKARGHSAVSTAKALTPSQLQQLAKDANCEAIILSNAATLNNLVPGKKPSLDAYRGSVLPYEYPILILNSFTHMNTVPHGAWLLEKDLDKLEKIKDRGPAFHYTVLEKEEMFQEALDFLSNCVLISHDLETVTVNAVAKGKEKKKSHEDFDEDVINNTGGDTLITCAGWSGLHRDTGRIHTYVLPILNYLEFHFPTEEGTVKAIEFLRAVNALPVPKAMHNGMYDATHNLVYHSEPNNWTIDTMAMAHSEFSELPKTLDFVASLELSFYIYWKEESKESSKNKDIRRYWRYNAKDCFFTLLIAIKKLQRMPAYARKNYQEQFKFVYPALYCNFEGMKIDQEARVKLREKAVKDLETAQTRLRQCMADENFNPGSWQQKEKYLYNVFGAVKPKIGKSKSCTDEKNLKAVAEQHPLLAMLTSDLLLYSKSQKAISNYMDFLQKNGRMLYNLNPFGTETSRMACQASSFWCGTQIQNVPPYAKAMLIADEGYELIEIDNSQSEARCTAYCAQDVDLIKALEGDKDFYKTLGFLFFGIPYEDVTTFFRNHVLKKIVHGTNYMMGAKTFVENVTVKVLHEAATTLSIKLVPTPKKENERTILGFAAELLDKYHHPFKRIRPWYEELKSEVLTTGKLVSPLGHTRVFFGDVARDRRMLQQIVAHQPQNLSVSILNKGMWRIYRDMVVLPLPPLSLGDFRLKAQIHDSILAQYRKELREIVKKMMIERMTNPVEVKGRVLRIPLDGKQGFRWIEAKQGYEDGCK